MSNTQPKDTKDTVCEQYKTRLNFIQKGYSELAMSFFFFFFFFFWGGGGGGGGGAQKVTVPISNFKYDQFQV